MPSFSSIALFGLATFGAAVNAACLSDDDAQQVATNYAGLIATYTDTAADAALATNFTDYSESVNTLINSCPQGSAAVTLPLLSPTFSSLAQFKLGQGQQPAINFQQLNIWHSCDTVIIRWMTTNTAPIANPKPVVGLITMHTVPAPAGSKYPYLIDNVYSEFDAGAWLQNLVDAGICTGGAGLTPNATTSSAATSSVQASTCTAKTVTITAAPASCVTSTGNAVSSASATLPPYRSSNGTGTWSAATGTASNVPAYTGPAWTGAASNVKASYAGFSAVFLGLLVLLN